MKKNIALLIALLIFQLVIGSLPGASVFALQSTNQSEIISPTFLSEVSLLKSLVPIIVELKKDATLDFVNAVKSRIIMDNERVDYRESLVSYQEDWLSGIQRGGISFQKNGSCTDSINMVSLQIKGTDIVKISLNRSVKKIYDNRMVIKPHRTIMSQSTGVDRVWKGTDTIKATGKNILVGVIDTGMDVDHPEFKGKVLGGKNYVDGESYRTDKIGHGTHVAGIIGGLGDSSHGKGMAPDVKFYTYKALGPKGGTTDWIMQAMDQAVKDKCSIINMSLGRVGGEDSKNGNPYYGIIKRIVDANVLVVAASGNSGARGKNVPWPAGSPGIVEGSLCVAASNDRNARMTYSSVDRTIPVIFDPVNPLTLPEINFKEVVDCNYGSNTDFSKVNVKGKVALIKRGPLLNPISFADKMREAKNSSAKVVIFADYNNDTRLLPTITLENPLPFLCVSNDDGNYLKSTSQTSTNSLVQIEGLNMADFSSMGITPDGAFKPEITAPGVNIMSPIPRKSYAAWSGTSMACPSIAGQAALIKEAHPDWKVDQIKSAMMNTAYIIMNPTQNKPVTFMLQGAGQCRVEKAIQTPAFISPRAFVVENSENTKLTFSVTNATKEEITSKVSVEYFIDTGEESPVIMDFDKKEVKVPPTGNATFSVDIQITREKFARPRIEGVIWVGDLHIPFIILRESSVTDNGKALKNPISDIFCNSQQIDYSLSDQSLRVNFSFNTGSEQKYEGEISYSNYGNVKIFVADPQGLLWDPRPIKEFKQCVIGDYTFEWNRMTTSKDFLPNGQFSLKFECSASDDNEIISKPLMVSNSPQESVPTLILASPRYQIFESDFCMDLYIPTLTDVKEIEYTLYFDTKKLRVDRAEKTDVVTSWDTPTIKSDSIRIRMSQFAKPVDGSNRIKLASIYFSAKAVGFLKHSNKAYVTLGNDKKIRTLGFLPDVQITKKTFLLGDINKDKIVDMNDYFLAAKSFDVVYGELNFNSDYDVNQDLMINQTDLDIILAEMGKEL